MDRATIWNYGARALVTTEKYFQPSSGIKQICKLVTQYTTWRLYLCELKGEKALFSAEFIKINAIADVFKTVSGTFEVIPKGIRWAKESFRLYIGRSEVYVLQGKLDKKTAVTAPRWYKAFNWANVGADLLQNVIGDLKTTSLEVCGEGLSCDVQPHQTTLKWALNLSGLVTSCYGIWTEIEKKESGVIARSLPDPTGAQVRVQYRQLQLEDKILSGLKAIQNIAFFVLACLGLRSAAGYGLFKGEQFCTNFAATVATVLLITTAYFEDVVIAPLWVSYHEQNAPLGYRQTQFAL